MSKVGINGFGRIGRLVLRRLLEVKSNIDVVAINDLTSPKILAYLLKHDSNYGPFPWSVDFTEDSLIVDGKSISVYAEKEAKNIPWKAKGAENIIPHTTGAAKAIGLVIPELSGKLKGHAQRVPVKTGSVTELVSILGKKVTAEEVNNALKQATTNNESFGYTDEEIVSSDIIGSHFGSVFDATQTEITAVGDLQLVKTVAWYDNEYGFVTQLIRTLEKFAKL
ncbi:hypothetical protein HUC33_19715 [Escherichia coli]|uniref:glyceraldehyde 3-phosphate dehydrogenase NAD-binding domain-containing protein n=1 Tax=Escherichia coli TaxID=562 RepID=UPI00157D9F41|nr:glyceraldehyde 3-phosphate dehydrogenase NAD-binding domain-containing protein [Escherichia coli]NUD91735.1 hypothetical protein [Escherichia coli]HEI2246608.1 hypothetical protein [Escherichia coli]